jgi:HEAT repeat protein
MFQWWKLWRLSGRLHSPLAETRREAVRGLGDIRDPRVPERLIPLLTDLDTSVRSETRLALRRQGTAALPALLSALDHSDPERGKAAAELLGELRDPQTVGPLLKALKFGAQPLRAPVGRALEAIGKPAVQSLRAALSDEYPYVRREVAGILARLGETVPPEQETSTS